MGPSFIASLLREKECGTKMILMRDDIVYGKDFIETLLKKSDKHPESCIYTGNNFDNADGILIKPEFVNNVCHEECGNKWLGDNITASKIHVALSTKQKALTFTYFINI